MWQACLAPGLGQALQCLCISVLGTFTEVLQLCLSQITSNHKNSASDSLKSHENKYLDNCTCFTAKSFAPLCSAQDGESADMNCFGCIVKWQTSDKILISCANWIWMKWCKWSRGWSTKLGAWTHACLTFTVNNPSKWDKTKHQMRIVYETYCTSYPTPSTTWSWVLQVGYLTTCYSIVEILIIIFILAS